MVYANEVTWVRAGCTQRTSRVIRGVDFELHDASLISQPLGRREGLCILSVATRPVPSHHAYLSPRRKSVDAEV